MVKPVPLAADLDATHLRRRRLWFGIEEGAAVEFVEGLAEFRLRVHDDGSVPGDRLFERLARDEEEAEAVIASLNHHFVATVKEHEGAVLGFSGRLGVQPADRFGWDIEGLG